MKFRSVIFTVTSASLALAADPAAKPEDSTPKAEEKAEAVQPSVKKLDESRYQIGEVIFDKKTREIRFSATLNMAEGLLEYLIVHQNGKIHESLLITEISPTHLNLAFTLLSYPPSQELYPLPSETGGASDKYPEVPEEIKKAARVTIDLEWEKDGKTVRVSANDCIQHNVKTTSMPPGPWVYGGSIVSDGQYTPEICGDIVSMLIAPSAILHYPGEDRMDDTIWTPFTKRLPDEGTKVTVIISPFQKNQTTPKQ